MDIVLMVAELTRDEGKRNRAYLDTVGKWTIGVGRNLEGNPLTEAEKETLLENSPDRDMSISGLVITDEEISVLLSNDIQRTWKALLSKMPWIEKLDEVRQRVLLNMAFNMGIGVLSTFRTTLGLIQIRKYDDAAHSMLQSKWASQVGKRAIRLAEAMATGEV